MRLVVPLLASNLSPPFDLNKGLGIRINEQKRDFGRTAGREFTSEVLVLSSTLSSWMTDADFWPCFVMDFWNFSNKKWGRGRSWLHLGMWQR